MKYIKIGEELIGISYKVCTSLDLRLLNLILEKLVRREWELREEMDCVQIFEACGKQLIHRQEDPEISEEYELEFSTFKSKLYVVKKKHQWQLLYADEYEVPEEGEKFEFKIHMPMQLMVTDYIRVSARNKEEAVEKAKEYLEKGYFKDIQSLERDDDWNSSYKLANSKGQFMGIISEYDSYDSSIALYSNIE